MSLQVNSCILQRVDENSSAFRCAQSDGVEAIIGRQGDQPKTLAACLPVDVRIGLGGPPLSATAPLCLDPQDLKVPRDRDPRSHHSVHHGLTFSTCAAPSPLCLFS